MNTESQQHGELNEAQLRRLGVTCSYIDKLLSEVEQVLHETTSTSPFPRHVVDVTPAQTRVLEDHIRRIREQLLRALAWQNMTPDPPEIPATRAALTHLAFVDIAIEELKPSYMRGSGAVPEDVAEELNGVVHELRSVAQSMERYLRQELGINLESRLTKLEHAGHDVALLQAIEAVVTRHGLVEFRSRIASLAARLEDNNLEVAFFGRVSSGKSSLLNALLGTDVLPVGVNPITAVPTRLRNGDSVHARITFASGRNEEVSIDEFRNLVSETGNPGNQRNVTHALVEIPSSRLSQGIVLVDTPGLGSLARRGAAETMAYLPSCDLAILLIDAGATLNDEDIGTLRLLHEGGISAIVLLSKTDLLAETDLQRVATYVETQVGNELGIKIHVQPVSALPNHSGLLDQFFEQQLLPRFNEARNLRQASVARKIGALRESVIAALETSLQRGKRQTLPANDGNEIEAKLRHITGEIGEQRSRLDQAFLELGERPQIIVSELAEMAAVHVCSERNSQIDSSTLAEWISATIQKHVDLALVNTSKALSDAVAGLRETAKVIARSDMPTEEEAEALLRNAPQFEMASVPRPIGAVFWRWFGRKTAMALARHSLQEELGESFKDELHRYGRALSQWSEHTARRMQFFVGSYADAYRAQLRRISGQSSDVANSPELESDLSRLLNWNVETAEIRS
ncbi:MAG: dynamin family protein [Terracidiphilus sp.]|jgi:GTP-binding protein EngB required for normal cell division